MPDELLNGGGNPNSDAPAHWSSKYEGNQGIKDLGILKKFNTIDDAIIALDHAERRLSQKLVDYPSQDASEDDVLSFINGVRSRLPESFRVPEKPDGYKITATVKDAQGKDIPIAFDESALKEMQAACHEAGIDNRTFNRLMLHLHHAFSSLPDRYSNDMKEYLKEQAKTNPTTPSYEEFRNSANAEFDRWPDHIKNYVKQRNLPADAIALIANYYAVKNGETRLPSGQTPPSSTMSLTDIIKRQNELMDNKEYQQQLSMGRGPLYEEFNRLQEMEKQHIKKGK